MEWNQYNPFFPALSSFGTTSQFHFQGNGVSQDVNEEDINGDQDDWMEDPYDEAPGAQRDSVSTDLKKRNLHLHTADYQLL